MWDLVPWPEIEPRPTALGVHSLSHWTTREVAVIAFWSHRHQDCGVGRAGARGWEGGEIWCNITVTGDRRPSWCHAMNYRSSLPVCPFPLQCLTHCSCCHTHSLPLQVKPIWGQKALKQPQRPSVGFVHSHLPILNQILVAPLALCCLWWCLQLVSPVRQPIGVLFQGHSWVSALAHSCPLLCCNNRQRPPSIVLHSHPQVPDPKVKSESHSVKSDSFDRMDYAVHGILQARILEWVGFPFYRGSSQPRDQTQLSHIAGRFFTRWATREAQEYWSG